MTDPRSEKAFGAPGTAPTWTSSAKDLVTTALGPSRVWATLGYGILNEIYWPSTGEPQVRDLGFIVAREGEWAEVKRAQRYAIETPEPHVLAPTVVHEGDWYRLTLEIVPDPARDVLLVRYRLEGDDARLYPLLAPHLGTSGWSNTAWIADGLFAQAGDRALCLLGDPPFRRASAGHVGASDGWQDFAANGRMAWTFQRAENGNVALMAETAAREGTLALAFDVSPEGARTLALSSLAEGHASVREALLAEWRAWGSSLEIGEGRGDLAREARLSAAVLKAHEDRHYPGAIVASLSIPWGNASNDVGGYHLVWTRDAVEIALALAAAGQTEDAQRTLAHLVATQADDGCWAQNFFPDGRSHWTGIQLDEVAFPILLAARLRELGTEAPPAVVEMMRRAARYVARNGPSSPQDRWEERAGTTPFTLAVEIAALVAAADVLPSPDRDHALVLADCWNERIEELTCVGGEIAAEHGVPRLYADVGAPRHGSDLCGRVDHGGRECAAAEPLVGLGFLHLVRLGLRAADAPAILDTVKVADALLRVDTPSGPAWRRYVGDHYGEHEDGSPYDGGGIGRAWPLLTGERGHFALERGEDVDPYLQAMLAMSGPGGLIPEQVWDSPPLPGRALAPGRPTGSAMPLAWAHAEFLKLYVARDRGRPVEQLDVVRRRYGGRPPRATTWTWRDELPCDELPSGRALIIEDREAMVVRFSLDGWKTVAERASAPLGLGLHGVRFESAELARGARLDFTRFYPAASRWEGADHAVALRSREG